MKITTSAAMLVLAMMAGCASTGPQQAATAPARSDAPTAQKAASTAPASGNTRVVKSRDGSYTGEISGTPAADSKFAKLLIGMELNEVQKIVGRFPDQVHSYESGKRWIPFYFGNDARRMQVLYKGEGCLIFTGGGAFSAGGDLIQIAADPTGACYVP